MIIGKDKISICMPGD